METDSKAREMPSAIQCFRYRDITPFHARDDQETELAGESFCLDGREEPVVISDRNTIEPESLCMFHYLAGVVDRINGEAGMHMEINLHAVLPGGVPDDERNASSVAAAIQDYRGENSEGEP